MRASHYAERFGYFVGVAIQQHGVELMNCILRSFNVIRHIEGGELSFRHRSCSFHSSHSFFAALMSLSWLDLSPPPRMITNSSPRCPKYTR